MIQRRGTVQLWRLTVGVDVFGGTMGGIKYPGLENLPAMTHDLTTLFLLREAGYVTLVFQRPNGDRVGVFTLHRVEAKDLAERVRKLVDGQDGDTSLVEGAYIGGPLKADQLLRPKD